MCEDDTDADGVVDRLDNCPKNPFMNVTNFEDSSSTWSLVSSACHSASASVLDGPLPEFTS